MHHVLRFVACVLATLTSFPLHAADRANILWITAEDMSPTLGCYGDDYAITPHIDRLASESVRYTHAFATAPVCSPVRSCLVTGIYATSLGTHNMRSAFPLPDCIHGFPSYLRKAGYFTTNNEKTDYNTSSWKRLVEESWDESSNTAHWRKRPAAGEPQGASRPENNNGEPQGTSRPENNNGERQGASRRENSAAGEPTGAGQRLENTKSHKPFFSVFNLMTSHQSRSMVWTYGRFVKEVQSRLSPEEIHDPAKAPLPPYYPDTPIIRKTVARFYDCVTAMDKEVGAILEQLEEDGLADDTIVFFFSDHGSGMPRHKRALLDSGMHVPLLIRFPDKYRHLAPVAPGMTCDRLVSFVDFPPTVINLAGIESTAQSDVMWGKPFLASPETEEREYAFGHRDRVDEAIDMARSVRSKRFLYIRNFMPHLGYNQPTAWPDLGEIRHEFYRLTDKHRMTPEQWHFAGPTRSAEELYDCEQDPLNLHNLAASPDHADQLNEMRHELVQHCYATVDLGLIPETSTWHQLKPDSQQKPVAPFARSLRAGTEQTEHARQFRSRFVSSLNAAFTLEAEESPDLNRLTEGCSPGRYWAIVKMRNGDSISDDARKTLKSCLSESPPSIRIAAASVLCHHDGLDVGLPALMELLTHDDLTVVLHAARAIELLGPDAKPAIPAMRKLLARAEQLRPSDTPATFVQSGDQDLAMFASFAARGFLSRIGTTAEQPDKPE